MVKAYPINNKGIKEGATRSFTNEQWDKMVRIFGKKLHWRIADKSEQEGKEIELISKKDEFIGDHIPVSTKKTKRKSNKHE